MLDPIPQEIYATPEAIRQTVTETRPQAWQAAQMIRKREPRHIYIIGNGTSLYSSMAAAYTARLLAKPGDPLVLAWPAGDFRHFMPQIGEQDVVVGVSASGEFRDVLAVFKALRGKALLVGVTHIAGSSLTKLGDATLVSAGGPSKMAVMTKTYASTLTAEHLLLLETFQASETLFADLAASAGRAGAAIEAAEAQMEALAPGVAKIEHGFYFGAGGAYPAALEGALKMKEMALLHSEGAETWEWESGPATRVGPDTFCAALYTGGETDADTADGARHAREWGARVIEAGPQAAAGDWHLPIPAPEFAPFASLALVPPLALLAYRVARQRGQTPDSPTWRERYHSQGLHHILGES